MIVLSEPFSKRRIGRPSRRRPFFTALAVLWVALAWLSAPALGEEPAFLGVATCANGTCHGSMIRRSGTAVSQNEYRVWAHEDDHSGAFATLRSERSRDMARMLGLTSAESARECLACHAHTPPIERRGPKFQVDDGIGCEACHGPASRWIESHDDADTNHDTNLRNGMTALERPEVRASVCLPCHQGNAERMVDHRMMAAGHPRLSFELDTFTHLQPAHFVLDADYQDRKDPADSATVWAVGLAAGIEQYVATLDARHAATSGAWPDFALYDCFSCHHDMRKRASAPDGDAALGLPRLALPSLGLYRKLVAVTAPAELSELDTSIAALHSARAANLSVSAEAANRLERSVASRVASLSKLPLPSDRIRALVLSIAEDSGGSGSRTYAEAEQTTMALQALIATLVARGQVSQAQRQAVETALDGLFQATEDPAAFAEPRFRTTLARLRAQF